MNSQTRLVYLLPLRLFVGLSFILAGQNKIGRGDFGAAYAESVQGYVQGNLENAFGFYRPFLEGIVLPNTETFAVLFAWNEFLFGALLFLGLFTRLGAAFGMFQLFNLTLTTGRGLWLPGMDAAYFFRGPDIVFSQCRSNHRR